MPESHIHIFYKNAMNNFIYKGFEKHARMVLNETLIKLLHVNAKVAHSTKSH